MLAGQYVYLPDGRTGQLLRTIETSVRGPAGAQPAPAVDYELNIDGQYLQIGPIPSGSSPWWWTRARLIAALHSAPRPLPPCVVCDALTGRPCSPECPSTHEARVPASVTA